MYVCEQQGEADMSPEERITTRKLRPYLDVVDPLWAHLNQFEYVAAIDAAERVREYVRSAVIAEREACAQIADTAFDRNRYETYSLYAAILIAAAIRARSNT